MVNQKKLKLKDNRNLGYAEYGELSGTPVLLFHGTPGSRFQGELSQELSQDKGIRLIVVERPGYGNSDAKPGRTLLEWCEDIRQLLGELQLEKVAIIGVSGGGPYALACSALMGDAIHRTVVVSGMGQLETEESMSHISEEERMLIQAAQYAPEQMAAQIAQIHENPEALASSASEHLPDYDKSLITSETIKRFLKSLKEATRSAEGMISDYKIFAQPWGFAPEEIRVPVTFFHGNEDTTVSIYHSEKLASKIENADLKILEGAGHLGGSIGGVREALLLL